MALYNTTNCDARYEYMEVKARATNQPDRDWRVPYLGIRLCPRHACGLAAVHLDYYLATRTLGDDALVGAHGIFHIED